MKKKTLKQKQEVWAYVFISPALMLMSFFLLIPIISSFYLSFTKYNFISPLEWMGITNYKNLFTDELFLKAFMNTIYFSAVAIPLGMSVSLLLACLVNKAIKGISFLRTAYYIPVVTSTVAVSLIWMWIYDPSFGILNYIISKAGIGPREWLRDTQLAMPCVIVVVLWQRAGYYMIIFLGALKGISQSLYEAASIDGANRWQCFLKITLPLIKPVSLLVLVLYTIGCIQIFDQVYVMTEGGPANATTTLVHQIYTQGFKMYKMGYASAMAFFLFFVIFMLTMLYLALIKSK